MPTLLLRPMRARDAEQEHRASTPLELFFDLTFVVAVSFAAVGFAHALETDHLAHGLATFALVFFATWWGWLNFTWFASAYDTDDWLYRLVTLVQMGGALTVAAGVPRVYEHADLTVVVIGYAIMRFAMVAQWLRAARNDPDRRRVALTYAIGIATVQVLWIARLQLPHGLVWPSVVVLILAELAVPALAERQVMTPFHRGHVTERYGLFTIIVLGEGVLAAGNSVIESLQDGEHVVGLVTLAVGGLVLLAGMWWTYFAVDGEVADGGVLMTMVWGYGHYLIFASIAAVSAGIEVQVAAISGHVELSDLGVRLSVAAPAAIYLLVVWALVLRSRVPPAAAAAVLVAVAAVAAAGLLPLAPQVSTVATAVIVALAVAALVVTGRRRAAAPQPA